MLYEKIKLIAISLLVVISMVGCESSTAKKAVEQGKLLMTGKEYDKALALFKLAIDEGSKDEEIKFNNNSVYIGQAGNISYRLITHIYNFGVTYSTKLL